MPRQLARDKGRGAQLQQAAGRRDAIHLAVLRGGVGGVIWLKVKEKNMLASNIDDGELVLLRERQCPIKKLEPISSEVALQHP